MRPTVSSRQYDAIVNTCVFVAIAAALLYDHVGRFGWLFLVVGVLAAGVAATTYFIFHGHSDQESNSELVEVLVEIDRAVEKLKGVSDADALKERKSSHAVSENMPRTNTVVLSSHHVWRRNPVLSEEAERKLVTTVGDYYYSLAAARLAKDFRITPADTKQVFRRVLEGSAHEPDLELFDWYDFVRFRRQEAVGTKRSARTRVKQRIGTKTEDGNVYWGVKSTALH